MGHEKFGQVFDFGVLHMEWPTALFIFVVFVITMFFLNTWLFQPIIQSLEARDKEVDSGHQEAKDLAGKINAAEQDYQSKLNALLGRIEVSRKEALAEAMAEAEKILSEAKEKASQTLSEARKEISGEREKSLQDAKALTAELAQLINTKAIA